MNSPEATRSGRRVLIVDDSVDTAKMMKLLLKREGFEARTAYDGPQAIEVSADFQPEVVLLDLTLPGMSGQEVAAELRKNEASADTLIVAISGYGDGGVPPGFDHLLVKPLDHDALLNLLASTTFPDQTSSPPADLPAAGV